MSFRDVSLRGKLLLSFGAVLVVTAVLGGAAILEMGSMKSAAGVVSHNALPSVRIISHINADEQAYRRDQLMNVLSSDPATVAQIATDLKQKGALVDAGLSGYRALVSNGPDRTLWQQEQSEWSGFVTATAALSDPKASATDPHTMALVLNTRKPFLALAATNTRWSAFNDALAKTEQQNSVSAYNTGLMIVIALLVLAIALGTGIALRFSAVLRRSVQVVLSRLQSLEGYCIAYIQEGLKAFSEGDLTHTYEPVTPLIENPSGDEIGQIGTAVNSIRNKTVEAILAYNETQAKLSGVVGEIADAATSVSASSEQLTSSSDESGRAADESGRAVGEIATALGDIAVSAQRQVENVSQVRSSAEEVGHAVQEIAQGAQSQVEEVERVRASASEVSRAITDIAHGAEEQVRVVAVASSSAEEVASAVATASRSAQETAAAAHETREVARNGVTSAEKASEAMASVRDASHEVNTVIHELASKSEQIGEIVGTITGIAEQTNLLALNAAIEAARAGEQGRGFAVVAEEVRKLAEESQAAASQISDLIGAMQNQTVRAVDVVSDGARRTEEGVTVVSETREAFLLIGDAVEDMANRIDQIAAISDQIAAAADTMQQSINAVAAVAEQASASAQQVSASADEVSASADVVAASAEQASASAQQVSASAQQVSAAADQVASSAEQASATTQEVSASAEEVSASTQEVSASAQQVAASAQALSENAQLLAELVARFKVVEGAAPVNAA